MDSNTGPTEWRHLLPIPGLEEDGVGVSRPIRVVVDVDTTLVDQPGVQHLTWLLVTLLTRSTNSVIAAVGISSDDRPLLQGHRPRSTGGRPSRSSTR